MDFEQYDPLIPSNHYGPKAKAFIELALSHGIAISNFLGSFIDYFNVNNAIGKQLDIIGNIIGVNRNVKIDTVFVHLNDEDFRLLIMSRIAQAHWDGTNQGAVDVFNDVFKTFTVKFQEYADDEHDDLPMYVKYMVSGVLTSNQRAMIDAGILLPVPAGVKATFVVTSELEETDVTAVMALNNAGSRDDITVGEQTPT